MALYKSFTYLLTYLSPCFDLEGKVLGLGLGLECQVLGLGLGLEAQVLGLGLGLAGQVLVNITATRCLILGVGLRGQAIQ